VRGVVASLSSLFQAIWPSTTLVILAALLILLARWLSNRSASPGAALAFQLATWFIASVAVVGIVIVLPLTNETRGQILSLLGVVLTAVIALSSTTFVSNAMAGVMLQATQPFRPGDYLRVNDEFGRVTRRSLLHTQIQTETSDFTTLPNLLLINSPITVLHREGTIITSTLSLGYDIDYRDVEPLLLDAAAQAGLEEPFVLVDELLDHAVSYRICGFLPETKHPLSARSRLRKKVLEVLHASNIEIASPSFMNQRRLEPGDRAIPLQRTPTQAEPAAEQAPEEKIFEKAEQAASMEELKQDQEGLRQEIKRERAHLKGLADEEREALEKKVARLERRENLLTELIEERENNG
jgi:small-conductance mechanosensitive channel